MKEFLSNVLNMKLTEALSVKAFIYFYSWAIVGQVTSILIERLRQAAQIKKAGGRTVSEWFSRNIDRILLTLIVMGIGVCFTQPLLSITLNVFTAFLAGFGTDKTIEALTKFKR